MNILVLTAHPDLSTSTANRKWFEALSEVEGIITRDLTAVGGAEMRFNPAIEQALLEQADRVVLQFPFYWYSSPPLLKAWLDQVLLMAPVVTNYEAKNCCLPSLRVAQPKAFKLAHSTASPWPNFLHHFSRLRLWSV